MSGIRDYSFDVDKFDKPLIYKNDKAVKSLLTKLILLNPGTFPSHPNMGVGLVERYQYSTEESKANLKSDIKTQIDKYLPPNFNGAIVEVEYYNKNIYISITIDDRMFQMFYDTNSDKVETIFKRLDDL